MTPSYKELLDKLELKDETIDTLKKQIDILWEMHRQSHQRYQREKTNNTNIPF